MIKMDVSSSFILFFSLFFLPVSVLCQVDDNKTNHLAIGVGATTLGPRVEVAMPLTSHITFRGGLSLFSYSQQLNFSISADDYRDYIDYDPDLNAFGKFSLANAHLLADYTSAEQGFFHFTAGVVFGSSKLDAHGLLINPENQRPMVEDLRDAGHIDDNLPEVTLEDNILFRTNSDGSVAGSLILGKSVKPYIGFGFGRAVPKNRIALKLEFGLLYQGKPEITSPNLMSGNLNNYFKNNPDLKPYYALAYFYPMVNMQFAFRFF